MKKLIFESYRVNFPFVEFFYNYNNHQYCYQLKLDSLVSVNAEKAALVDPSVLNRIYNYIGIAICIRFFAIDYFDLIEVKGIGLTEAELAFFSKNFTDGFAEYRHVNNISTAHQIKVVSTLPPDHPQPVALDSQNWGLVCNGGGKDSIVAAEICRNLDMPFSWLVYDPNPAQIEVMQIYGKTDAVIFHNLPDPNIAAHLQYKGHKPFSLFLACLSLLPAAILKYRYIVVANEYSANFGNRIINGFEVNHQFTKSWEFEKGFRDLVHNHISKDLEYFSMLRPVYELKIAQLFSRMPRYFGNFISCNKQKAQRQWCGECAKCAFVYLALSAFLPKVDLIKIFGKDLFTVPAIKVHVKDLVTDGAKPFECVGTKEECLVAYHLCMQKDPQATMLGGQEHQEILEIINQVDIARLQQEVLKKIHTPHAIPSALWPKVKDIYQSAV